MPNLKTIKYLAPEKQFLAFPDHYVTLPGKIAYAELVKLKATGVAGTYGSKVVIPRGTVVHMDADGNVTKPTYVKTTNESGTKPNAILFNTIEIEKYDTGTDVTVNAAVLVHGYVRKDRLFGDKDNLDNAQIFVVNK